MLLTRYVWRGLSAWRETGGSMAHQTDCLRSLRLYQLDLGCDSSGRHSHPVKPAGAIWHGHTRPQGCGNDPWTRWASFCRGQISAHVWESSLFFFSLIRVKTFRPFMSIPQRGIYKSSLTMAGECLWAWQESGVFLFFAKSRDIFCPLLPCFTDRLLSVRH